MPKPKRSLTGALTALAMIRKQSETDKGLKAILHQGSFNGIMGERNQRNNFSGSVEGIMKVAAVEMPGSSWSVNHIDPHQSQV